MSDQFSKVETPQEIKGFYKDSKTVDVYEEGRYGNIKRSLYHWMDCDAIEYFMDKNIVEQNPLVLDLACGTGRLTRSLWRPHRRIKSLDYSFEMLSAAKVKVENLKIPFAPVCGDVFSLPLKNNSLNGIFTIRCIRHFHKEERVRIYRELCRVLKEGGVLIFDVLNADVDREAGKRKVYDETYTLSEITAELKENGFVLRERLAGNIAGNALATMAKKWKLTSFGRWWVKGLRGKQKYLDQAASWVVCVQKISSKKSD